MRVLLLIFLSIAFANAQLICYGCRPSNTGKCEDPENNNPKIDTCSGARSSASTDLWRSVATTETNKNFCFTLYFHSTTDAVEYQTGFYRSCTFLNCTQLEDKFKIYGNVKSCSTCDTENCNKGGTTGVTISAFTLVFTMFATMKNL